MLLQRITIKAAAAKGLSKAAPLLYSNWYSYTAKIDGILLDPYWARFATELRETDRLFVDYGLHKEVAFLLYLSADPSLCAVHNLQKAGQSLGVQLRSVPNRDPAESHLS